MALPDRFTIEDISQPDQNGGTDKRIMHGQTKIYVLIGEGIDLSVFVSLPSAMRAAEDFADPSDAPSILEFRNYEEGEMIHRLTYFLVGPHAWTMEKEESTVADETLKREI